MEKLKNKINTWIRTLENRAWKAWAKAASVRALKTVGQTILANMGVAAAMSTGDWLTALSASALAGLASLAMSLVSLPEVDGGQADGKSWFGAAMVRSIRTIGQSLAASLTACTLLSEVHWATVIAAALLAGAMSLLTSLVGLPEVEE